MAATMAGRMPTAAGIAAVTAGVATTTGIAAMIAVAGLARLKAGQHDGLEIQARARWPLESLQALNFKELS